VATRGKCGSFIKQVRCTDLCCPASSHALRRLRPKPSSKRWTTLLRATGLPTFLKARPLGPACPTQVSDHSLQPSVLVPQLLQMPSFADVQAAVLGVPSAKRAGTHAALTGHFGDLGSRFHLFQDSDYLLFLMGVLRGCIRRTRINGGPIYWGWFIGKVYARKSVKRRELISTDFNAGTVAPE